MVRAATLLFTLLSLLAPLVAGADPQQRFATRQQNMAQQFAYQWKQGGQPRQLSFTLNTDDIARGSTEFAAWDEQHARDYALKYANLRAAAITPPGVTITLTPHPEGFRLRAQGEANRLDARGLKAMEQQLHKAYMDAIGTYAATHYYKGTLVAHDQIVLQPDHVKLASRYTAAMSPVAKAIATQVGTSDPRTFINFALSWLQAIPYDTLEDRSTSNGAGFQTPYGLLLNNLGDCDTKTTALAALLRATYPQLPLTMVYTPKHAFLGIGLPQGPKDYALQSGNQVFVLADPTGPAQTPLGQTSREAEAAMATRNSTLGLIP